MKSSGGAEKKCTQCGKILKPGSYFEGKKRGVVIGSGVKEMEDLFAQVDELNSAAYKCRGCGTFVCSGCLRSGSKCPECGGIIFDLADSI